MGQLKKLTSDVIRLSGKYPTGVLENPEPIAQRFAHSSDVRRAARRVADPPRAPRSTAPSFATQEQTPSPVKFTRRTWWLIAGLVSAAWVPCVILGGMWFGSTGALAPPTAQTPAPQPMAPHAVLTTSARIEAKAGDTVGFPIALDGTDGVPSRSVIAIEGLPQASNLSEGRPYGESDWMLKPDQIADLQLVLPRSTTIGEFKLAIALVGPDENIIARAETILTVAPAPTPLEPVMAEDSDGPAALPGGEVASLDAGSGDRDAARCSYRDGGDGNGPIDWRDTRRWRANASGGRVREWRSAKHARASRDRGERAPHGSTVGRRQHAGSAEVFVGCTRCDRRGHRASGSRAEARMGQSDRPRERQGGLDLWRPSCRGS